MRFNDWPRDGAPMNQTLPGSKTLRVLRITPHFYRPGLLPAAYDPVGGLQRQLWKLTEGLSEAGVAQTVFTSHIPGSPRHSTPFPLTSVKAVGIAVPERFADSLLNFSWFWGVVRQVLLTRSRGDLIHLHFNHSIWCRIFAACVGMTTTPIVISLNTAVGGILERLATQGPRIDLRDWIERLALARARCVIALTQNDAERVAPLTKAESSRLVVIPDAIDEGEFGTAPGAAIASDFRRHLYVPQGAKIVSFVGRISAEKGWQDFPALLNALGPDFFLLICGDGRDRAKLEADLRATRLANWRITGFLSPHEVRMALGITSVLILPSRREAFGSVLLEAMATGVPAVAYAVGGVVEVAGTPPAISLVPPGDQRTFARCVIDAATDHREREILIERGRVRVKDFSLASSVEKTIALYRSLIRQDEHVRRPVFEPCGNQSIGRDP